MSWGSTLPVPVKAGTLHQTNCNENAVQIALTLPMKIRVMRRYNNAAAIHHGYMCYNNYYIKYIILQATIVWT